MQNSSNTNYSGIKELQATEILKNYNYSIVSKAYKYMDDEPVVDFGAGIGTLSELFRSNYGISPICIEIDSENIKFLEKRGFEHKANLEDCNRKFNFIFSSNVLEHIENDLNVLELFYNSLEKNGKVFLYLPANMLLWSEMDAVVGHYRRYTKKEIKEKLVKAGFSLVKVHYADSLGFFATFFIKVFGFKSSINSDTERSFKIYDKFLFPISNFLDSVGLKFFLGKNIVVVARK